jgi:flagellar assembly protein FliH
MTSSYRATGAASVRQMSVGDVSNAGLWSLNELAMPTPSGSLTPVDPAAAKAEAAADNARMIDEAYARGLVDGERKGAAAAQARLSDALTVLEIAAKQLREAAALAPAELEDNIAALATVVARQIIAREVALDASLVADLVRRALTEFPIDQSVRIRVNPQDLTAITVGIGPADSTRITANRDASWLADPRVVRGGCLIEGRDRIIDGRVDTALERAYRRMAELDAA